MGNILDKSYRENQNKGFVLSNFFRIACNLWESGEKNGGAREAADNMEHAL